MTSMSGRSARTLRSSFRSLPARSGGRIRNNDDWFVHRAKTGTAHRSQPPDGHARARVVPAAQSTPTLKLNPWSVLKSESPPPGLLPQPLTIDPAHPYDLLV